MNFDYNPFERKYVVDPYPYYEAMRQDGAVHYWEKSGLWTVCTYEAVKEAIWKTEAVSSRAVGDILLGGMPGESGDGDHKRLTSPTREEVRGVLVTADPPVHTELRNIVNRAFSPSVINALEVEAKQAVDGYIEQMREAGSFDLMTSLCKRLPSLMIYTLLNIDEKYHQSMRQWSEYITQALHGSKRKRGPFKSSLIAANQNVNRIIKETVEEKMNNPDGGLISNLTNPAEEHALNKQEAINFAGLLIFVGAETTTHLIGNSVYSLLQHPELIDQIVTNPKLIKKLIEETLRWNSVAQNVFRRAIEDVDIGGQKIPKGANICLLLASANRDEQKWGKDAHEFKLNRKTTGHFGFGFGPHICVGSSLARMEARVALERIIPMMKDEMICRNERFELIDSTLFRGYTELNFEMKAAR